MYIWTTDDNTMFVEYRKKAVGAFCFRADFFGLIARYEYLPQSHACKAIEVE